MINFERENNKYYFEQFLKKSNIEMTEDIIFPHALQQAYLKETKLQLDLVKLTLMTSVCEKLLFKGKEGTKCYISLEVWLKSGARPTWDDYAGPKTLVMIYDRRLYLISERLDKWIFTTNISLEDTLDILETDEPSNDATVNAIRNYLKVEKRIGLSTIKRVILDENGIPFIDLEFAS